jgi:UDP-glucose 4-epimerase
VLEVLKAFEAAFRKSIPYKINARRPGDVAASYTDPRRAHERLNWKAKRDLSDMGRDHWRWRSLNSSGYEPSART